MGAGYLISSDRVSLAFIGTSEMTLTRKADGNTVLNRGSACPAAIPNSRLRNRAACSNGFPAKGSFRRDAGRRSPRLESYEQPQMKLMEVPFAAFDEIRKEVK